MNDFVKGKKKSKYRKFLEGGVKIEKNTVICQVHCGDKIYKIRGVVDGFIIEFNQKLIDNPNLLL
jgi:glycine cleavage system H lipoate-binding protein